MKCRNGHDLDSINFDVDDDYNSCQGGIIIEYCCPECGEVGRLDTFVSDFAIWDEEKEEWVD